MIHTPAVGLVTARQVGVQDLGAEPVTGSIASCLTPAFFRPPCSGEGGQRSLRVAVRLGHCLCRAAIVPDFRVRRAPLGGSLPPAGAAGCPASGRPGSGPQGAAQRRAAGLPGFRRPGHQLMV